MAGLFGKYPTNSLASLAGRYQYQSQPNALSDVWRQAAAPTQSQPDYGQRVDGTKKGRGFLGEIPTPDGRVMTEYSIGVDWGEGEQEIPSVVPTLTREEIQYLARGEDPTPEIIDKAIEHAKKRLAQGLSPFAMKGIDY